MNSDQERAFTDFVTRSSPRLLTFARLLIGDHGDAEDALQVALMRLTRHWDRELDAPTAYVRQTLVNIARDRARRRHLLPLLTSSGAVPDTVLANGDLQDMLARESVEALLDGLPPRQRIAVVLRVVEDCSEAETAALMRCAPGTVKSNLARGLERLRANHAHSSHCQDPSEGARA